MNIESLEQMPIDLFPDPFGHMAENIVSTAMVPSSLAGCCVLSAMSASIGSGLRVESGPDQYSRANLFILASAKSGSGKSKAFKHAIEPLRDIEQKIFDLWHNEKRHLLEADKLILEAEMDKIKTEIRSRKESRSMDEIREDLAHSQSSLTKVQRDLIGPRFIVEDATQEALEIGLSNPTETLACLSADAGVVVQNLLGKNNKANKTDEAIFLKAWTGDTCKVDRVTRDSVILKEPCLSALMLVQPDKLNMLFSEKTFSDGGLLPRFLICHTNSKPTKITEDVEPIPLLTKSINYEAIEALTKAFLRSERQQTVVPVKAARDRMRSIQNELVDRMNDGDLQDILPFAARWAEQTWRISLVLHAGEHLEVAANKELEVETVEKAWKIARWFAAHQLRILESHREEMRNERFTQLHKLLVKYDGQVSLRLLRSNHAFNESEVSKLAK